MFSFPHLAHRKQTLFFPCDPFRCSIRLNTEFTRVPQQGQGGFLSGTVTFTMLFGDCPPCSPGTGGNASGVPSLTSSPLPSPSTNGSLSRGRLGSECPLIPWTGVPAAPRPPPSKDRSGFCAIKLGPHSTVRMEWVVSPLPKSLPLSATGGPGFRQ